MGSSDLKSLRSFLESIRDELARLRTSIDAKFNAVHDSQERERQKQDSERNIQVEIAAAISELCPTENEKSEQRSHRNKGLAIQFILMLGTIGAFVAAVIYAGIANKTYGEMKNQTKAALWSEYMACLNAQAAQATFVQAQKSVADTHIAAMAAAQQVATEIEAQRAQLILTASLPTQNIYLHKNPSVPSSIDQLGIPYGLENIGKTLVSAFSLADTAVLLKETDQFRFDKIPVIQRGTIGPGHKIPPDAIPNSSYRPLTMFIPVRDLSGNPIPFNSQEARDFFAGKNEVMVYGNLNYRDDWGEYGDRFCMAMQLTPPGGRRDNSSSNDISCNDYNHIDSHYFNLPKLETLPAPLPMPLVKCVTPVGQ